MFVLIKSQTCSNLGHLGLKTRSLGQIKEIPCGRSRGKISCSIHLKIGQNVCPDKVSDDFECVSLWDKKKKNNSLGQIKDIPCGRSRGNLSFSIDLK